MSASLFTKKELSPPTRVCFRLKSLRQEKKISLEEMEQKTRISKKYLQALEECRFRDVPFAGVYQKNFVKSYVEALGADPEPLLKQYLIEETIKEDKKPNTGHEKDIRHSRWWYVLPYFLRFGLILIPALILIGYLGWQVRRTVTPPQLVIYSPVEGFITQNNTVVVQGETEPEAQIAINGQEIKNSEKGQFKEEISLSIGVNTLEFVVKKKHGKTTTETRHVVYRLTDIGY
jgi:transcriptional regulator with XRE-family HTH domain